MNGAIEELKKSLQVYERKLGEHERELERLMEKTPIMERNIRDTEGMIFDLKASIFVLESMDRG
ncbi:hypothetical protein [Bacillus cereus]|uniref:hypothetical protein n=1 Tax=Bacillus cereus TaxID=1396 RepID=UPI00211386AB|nr:hypothetical protein [Bacillus cereus]MCQ6342525.1 hypothetical protein [Bacillus cereus]